jgi:hypothetical protein
MAARADQRREVLRDDGGGCDGPGDAAVLRPRLTSRRGLVVSNGMNPNYGDYDAYWMAASAIDEATRGWNFHPDNPGRLAAAKVLSSFYGIGQKDSRDWFARYARAALLAAEADLDEVETREDRTAMAETMVVGTVLGDALFAALRRVAQEHVTSQRYGSNAPKGSAD